MEEKEKDKKIQDFGQVVLENNKKHGKIHLMTIIGEIEGHDVLPASSKSTKYEHILPQLASIEDNEEIDGVLFLMNTVGGDVSAGLALAEMIASMSKPTVSLVLGDSHSHFFRRYGSRPGHRFRRNERCCRHQSHVDHFPRHGSLYGCWYRPVFGCPRQRNICLYLCKEQKY